MNVRRVIKLVAVISILLITGGFVLGFMYPAHWRVQAAEQFILSPWLGPRYLGEGKPATELILCNPMDLVLNAAGELLISDRGRDRRGRVIWRIDSDGIAHVVAGTGRVGSATAASARKLSFARPEALTFAPDGSLFVSDGFNHVVLRIDVDGQVSRIAGTGSPGFSGDGGPASEAMLHRPAEIQLDSRGNLYIADVRNHRVRMVDSSGRIRTIAGTGERAFSPDGTPAEAAHLDTPWGIMIDAQDRLIIADGGNHRVRRIDDQGRLVTIVGNGHEGFDGDGGPAVEAKLNFPEALFEDPSGRLFIGDELNHVVRVVDRNGIISTVIGTGLPGRAEIGARAQRSRVNDPESVLVDPQGDVIVSDGENGRVLSVSADGAIHLVAGRGDVSRCSSRW